MIPLELSLFRLIEHLNSYGIKAIFVGGFVRDYFTGHITHDLDIELYGLSSLETLENILRPFGKVGVYGKSFGVLKLTYGTYTIDFSPPRTESKSGFGHTGFEIAWYSDLSFSEAARRRDFTINAIGYDPITHEFLDPYNGLEDLHAKTLRCVDPKTFIDDPLRILRAMQFTARFDLQCDPQLLELCRGMIAKGALNELPKERIFEEFKKLFLLGTHPSIGLKLLEEMGGKYLFEPLCEEGWRRALETIDTVERSKTDTYAIAQMFAVILIDSSDPVAVLERLCNQRNILQSALKIIRYAKRSGTFLLPPEPLVQGRDLIALGLSPSERFKPILDEAYDAQLDQKFTTHDEALEWLKNYLVTVL